MPAIQAPSAGDSALHSLADYAVEASPGVGCWGHTWGRVLRSREPNPAAAAVIKMLRTLEWVDAGGACCQVSATGFCANPSLQSVSSQIPVR